MAYLPRRSFLIAVDSPPRGYEVRRDERLVTLKAFSRLGSVGVGVGLGEGWGGDRVKAAMLLRIVSVGGVLW